MDKEELAKKIWNDEADQYNQWDNISQEERDELIKDIETGIKLEGK